MTGRYVVHLPVVARDLPAAQRLARVLACWALVLPRIDPGETTVSAEDARGRTPSGLLRPAAARRPALPAAGRPRRRLFPPARWSAAVNARSGLASPAFVRERTERCTK